jgi:Copper type II ascorbate-dependent monooxygenase, C-terminal domain/Copper type II ascorbate-dependent monooxygenase, N-terminal domain
MKKHFRKLARGFTALTLCALGVTLAMRSTDYIQAVTRVQAVVNDESSAHGLHRSQGHFINANESDFAWTLTPALASNAKDEKLKFAISETPYMPNSTDGIDDYHCFVIDPKIQRDTFVTGVNVIPGNAKIVHHVVVFKVEGEDAVKEALAKNKASNGQGWTCFGGPGVGDTVSAGGNWVGGWVPGTVNGALPAGLGLPLAKSSLLIVQMHYNLSNGSAPDRSGIEISLAPAGETRKALSNQGLIAPVEIACASGLKTERCNRDNTLRENAEKFGSRSARIPTGLLFMCKKKLEDYERNVGDASKIVTSCDREVRGDGTMYGIAAHMHLRGQRIKIELNPDKPVRKTLLSIPKWDFHWQGNYWFKDPFEVKKGDVLRITCTFDNSSANQPIVGGKPLEPKYIVWGEGTADEMCLGTAKMVYKN